MNALIESTQELLRFAIAERDAFYDCSTDAEGNLNDPGDQAELERMDAMIDRARAALSDCANDREPTPVNLMFSTGHKDPFNFTASDRRFFVSYPAPPSVAVPEGWEFRRLHSVDGDAFGARISTPRIDGVCSNTSVWTDDKDMAHRMLAQMLTAAPAPDHSGDANKKADECCCGETEDAWRLCPAHGPNHTADAGKVAQPCRHCGEDPQSMHEHNNAMLPVIYWCECLSMAHMDYMRLDQWNGYQNTPSVPENDAGADAVIQFKDELLKSVKPIFRPHIEGVCAVVLERLRTAGDEGEEGQ